ncbi:hypothetical protein VQ045_08600 [Aurantimonas sp. E1-2-R+4]|uniref:hypothetical protein n=1 Tax=Aurantimonas sp. E1-2-R+4 TaxID=3113714 RepID=UPI002F94396D
MTCDKKYEPPLYLDMGFDEAMRRFAQTDKNEADKLGNRGKQKKPPGSETPTAKTRRKATPSSGTKGPPDG